MIANVKSTKGEGQNVLEKTIHKGSEAIMFSVLQETQYMYPFKSAVREIVSNSLDSIEEKKNAYKISQGELKVEDLFIEKEGEEFKDSKFNPDYYDFNWLDMNENDVTIHYIENFSPERDKIQFIDKGVGLGGDRLVNYFSLGFSTKRMSKNQLGSFGLGAKSLLATGIDYYTMISYYNGRKYMFNIFKDHVVSITPKFNDDGSKNKTETFYNGFECFYEETTEKNGVIVEAVVKKHRKNDYFDAIENQLGYIDNIRFLISDKVYDIDRHERKIKNTILFRNDDVIVGDRNYYARPQLILKPGETSNVLINYGVVDFQELEMKQYSGNVAFILNINDVDVTPSRENVIWNTKTRNAIKNAIQKAQKTIVNIIEEKIQDIDNIFHHASILNSFKSNSSSGFLSELYKVVDTASINVDFKGFKLNQNLDKVNSKDWLFTIAKKKSGYYSSASHLRYEEIKYKDSHINYLYLGSLHKESNNFTNSFVYIGETKYKKLGNYYAKHYTNSNNIQYDYDIHMVYINKTFYSELSAPFMNENNKLDESKLNKEIEEAYNKKYYHLIIPLELLRLIARGDITVLFDDDIDKKELQDLDKEAEDADNDRYLNWRERAKKENKVSTMVLKPSGYFDTQYLNEESIEHYIKGGNKVYLFRKNSVFKDIIYGSYFYRSSLQGFYLIGVSDDAYKRFIKVDGVMNVTDAIFKISFGDLYLTEIGKVLYNSGYMEKIIEEFKRNSRLFNRNPNYPKNILKDIEDKVAFKKRELKITD